MSSGESHKQLEFVAWFQSEFGELPPYFLGELELVQREAGLWTSLWPLANLCGHPEQVNGGKRAVIQKCSSGSWIFLYLDKKISLSLQSTPTLKNDDEKRLFLKFIKKCVKIASSLNHSGKVKIQGSEDEMEVTIWPDAWIDRDLSCHFCGEDSKSFWDNIVSVAEML